MKRTDTLMKVVSGLVFLAMVAYLGLYIAQRFLDPVQTALVVTATMSDSASMSGLVVRDELLLQNDAEYIDITVSEGEKVAAGQTVAVIYGSEAALDRAVRQDSLEREIESVTAALGNKDSTYTAGNREDSISDALIELSRSLRSDGMTGIDTRQSTLGSLLFRKEVSDATEDYLAELEAEYRDLLVSAAGDMTPVTVEEGGTFSSLVDGFEGVGPEYVKELTPDELRELIAADRTVDVSSIGKLSLSFSWYYAAIMDRQEALRLSEGDTVRLSFGRYYSEYLPAAVEYIGQADGDERLVLFRIDKAFNDMMAVRAVSADLIYSEYEGLRVPLKGLYRYYAAYMSDMDGSRLSGGDSVTLTLGGESYDAFVSEVGSAQRYGELPAGVEAGSEADDRPSRRLVVFCWPWSAEQEAPDFSAGGGTVTLVGEKTSMNVLNYYDYDPETDRLCVFTMTGLQAERKKVELVYAGDEYCLLRSEGDDALREGNEVIVETRELYNGKVFR
ncbi:MAG: HlyD family efflux transporter periplasmic adaptor subunit [Oscillospiraceae bacterium]